MPPLTTTESSSTLANSRNGEDSLNLSPNYLQVSAGHSQSRSETSTFSGSILSKGDSDAESNVTSFYDEIYAAGDTENEIERVVKRHSILFVHNNRFSRAKSEFFNADVEKQLRDTTEVIEYVDELSETESSDYKEEVLQDNSEFSSLDPKVVTWNGTEDPKHPRNWGSGRKALMTFIVALYTFVGPLSSSLLSPAMVLIVKEFKITNSVIASMVVSIYVLAWAICPLLCSPLSEMYGRKIVLNVSIVFLTFFNLGCGLSQNTAQLIIFRFLAGMASAPPMSIGAGVLADLYTDRERNIAMAWYTLGPTLGPIVGPVISGFLSEKYGWRWCFYLLVITCGISAVTGWVLLQETYSPVLLNNKAKSLRKKTGNNDLKTFYEMTDEETLTSRLAVNISRPITLLFTHPMVFGLGLFMAFVYGFMYLMIVTFPEVWGHVYGFTAGISGLMFLPLGIGYLIGILFWTVVLDKVYFGLTEKNGGVSKPEYRLPCLVSSGILIPVGLVIYGWGAQKKAFWIVPCIGISIYGFATIVVFQSIQHYLIDMNNRYSASAVGAGTVFKSLFGFVFPLFANKMYHKLDYGWGNTTCAFIALVLGVPFPLLVLKYGEKLRGWADRRMDKRQSERSLKNLQKSLEKRETIGNSILKKLKIVSNGHGREGNF